MTKAWIEMLHRYFAMAVGFLIIVLTVLAWRRWRVAPERSPWLASMTLVAVCLQGAFGALTVTMKLQPAIVTAHLLGGVGLLALLTWLALREAPSPAVDPRAATLRPLAAVAALMLLAQIALGGWVSTNYAVLACPDFPACHGRLVPADMNFAAGFTLWRDLGMTADGVPIPFQALVAIHWTHRSFAYLVLAVLALLAWRLWSLAGLSGLARALAIVLVLQFTTGLSSVVLNWPLLLAVLHNGGAAVLVALLVAINYRMAGSGAGDHDRIFSRAQERGRG
jgi:cytochrome c oxidase assembly protein subunit 15